jgi:two-component system NtrC family sensor kinase
VVEVGRDGDYADINVSDNGKGIPADVLPNIFRPFFTTKGQGTGLGLPLARRMVEDHGGRIEVASSMGKGSTFTVHLPLRRATGQPAS